MTAKLIQRLRQPAAAQAILRTCLLWVLRIGCLLLVLPLISPPEPRAVLGAAQSVSTEKPHLCVHTRLIDEVQEWKIQLSLEAVREMGASSIVEFFPWAYIERSPGHYDWEQADRIIRHAQNQGLRVIARMGYVPDWARPQQETEFTTLNLLVEESIDDFANFTAAFAARYRDTVNHIIIWNEPNLAFEWGYRNVDPVGYTAVLTAVYPRIKAVHPEMIVMGGALAPTLEPQGSVNGLNDLLYLEAMLEAGAADYFDALAVHTYGFRSPPDDPPAAERLNFRRAELLYELLERYGAADKPIYITESGWNDHPRWTNAVRPAVRIANTLQALEIAESWDWTRTLCIWVLRYPAPTFSYPDYFTLIGVDFQRKPIYTAIQAYAQGKEEAGTLWLQPPSQANAP